MRICTALHIGALGSQCAVVTLLVLFVSGWALFGDFIATFYSVSGLILSFIGSGWYSYIKLTEKRAPEPAAANAVVATAKPATVSQVPSPEVSIDQPATLRKYAL